MFKRITIFLVLLLCTLSGAQALQVSAGSAVLIEKTTGRVIYAKNANTKMGMASTTKIMTALLAVENCDTADQVKILPEYAGIEGSSMYLKAGETVTVNDLLHGVMLMSGNDAATAIAGYCGGDVDAFVDMMNQKAAQLGLDKTRFENPSGLSHDNHYTTAYQLAVLTAYALQNPVFKQIASTKTYTSQSGVYMSNHNRLLRSYRGATGVKTGFTKATGRCLVSSAERDGMELIAVTLNAPNDWADHAAMLDYGFANYKMVSLTTAGQTAHTSPVIAGVFDSVSLVFQQDCALPLTQNEVGKLVKKLHAYPFSYAPVTAGQRAGEFVAILDGKALCKVPLTYENSVDLEPERSFIDKLLGRRRKGN